MEKYIIQKSQKIVSALYLITDSIKDSDSIKWEIREEAISFVSNATMFNTTLPLEKDHAIQSFTTSSEKLVSFLNISILTYLISSMNASIVIHEIESLLEFLKKQNASDITTSGYILSDTFFDTDPPQIVGQGQVSEQYKGHNSLLKTETLAKNKAILLKDKKNTRRENIINILKKDSNLTIKDFAKIIKDCSEKTIQRELLSLVEKGLVKKEGERRWSRYSLN